MSYFIISQNLTKSDLKLPKHAVLRVNLAWHKDLESVGKMLGEYPDNDIFLDIPIGRRKPPNHNHDLDNIASMANIAQNVKYVAVSNVEDPKSARYYCGKFRAKIVPKIETLKGSMLLPKILDALNYEPGIIMLDHEDLFSNLVHLKKEAHYLDVIDKIKEICRKKKAHLLRVKGIIFTDD